MISSLAFRAFLPCRAWPRCVSYGNFIPGIWWARTVVHWAKVKNYVAPPNHYSNQKLQDVWLSGD